MPPAARTIGGGIEVEGLRESIGNLRKWDADFGKAATAELRAAAIDVKKTALGFKPGGSRMGFSNRALGHTATAKGAGVKLRPSADPRALVAEYGEKTAHVWGRPYPQAAMKRRTAKPHRPPTSSDLRQNRGGYMVQPALRSRLPYWDHELARRLTLLFKVAEVRSHG